jgi:hypothetical protein
MIPAEGRLKAVQYRQTRLVAVATFEIIIFRLATGRFGKLLGCDGHVQPTPIGVDTNFSLPILFGNTLASEVNNVASRSLDAHRIGVVLLNHVSFQWRKVRHLA